MGIGFLIGVLFSAASGDTPFSQEFEAVVSVVCFSVWCGEVGVFHADFHGAISNANFLGGNATGILYFQDGFVVRQIDYGYREATGLVADFVGG